MLLRNNVLWINHQGLESLLKSGLIEGPLEDKTFESMTFIRDSTKIVFKKAEKYAKTKGYEVIQSHGLSSYPVNNTWAKLKVSYYKILE